MEYKISELILESNHQFIVANKPAGLEIQKGKSGNKSLKDLLEIYSKSTLYVVHRIDAPVSGVVVFAKQKSAMTKLAKQFQERTVNKTYLALIKETIKPFDTLTHHLKKVNKLNKSFVVESTDKDGKEAELEYETIASSDFYTLLKVKPLTEQHHQIRVQLAAIGAPIKGDTKYGFKRGNKDRSIHLHAWKLTFKHPVSGEKMTFEAGPPDESLWKSFNL